MNNTVFTQHNLQTSASELILDGIMRLRYETFIKRLDWDIASTDGREQDCFDDNEAHYIAVLEDDKDVIGCWRARSTLQDYMLKSVFPELLQGESAPVQDDIWEISRFAVKKGSAETQKGYFGDVTIDLVKSFYDFAKQNGIKSYVTVTTVACERLLRQLGVNLRRMGDGKVKQIGVERTVALWIQVDEDLNIISH
ncbi:N-acyl-L-homoserine lactone synthetase [Shewanella psychrophila]|uniref:Acyl-homoserine-lactone synthase n=1 Tax=Shewanella psychrophila TaxID=225848 RepID=A0A1S6HIT3_9GAMM|nr:acyl-homoserine-lactone synthase [Shewanella psychrophila]AQS35431.1 N-acyl-L-homoserine lactone synthetase [Shewanella psychrophila]